VIVTEQIRIGDQPKPAGFILLHIRHFLQISAGEQAEFFGTGIVYIDTLIGANPKPAIFILIKTTDKITADTG